MWWLHGNRMIPSLPEMSRGSAANVEEAGVAGFQPPHHLSRYALVSRYRNQMEVIRHQTISPHRQAILPRVVRQQIQKHHAILMAIKHLRSPVTALGDVVRQSWY